MGERPRSEHATTATCVLRWVAVVAISLLLTAACDAAAPADAPPEPTGLARPRAENARLARRIAELEVAIADLQRSRRKPIDQPVVRTWIERTTAPDGRPAFDMCVQYFAHGDFLDLLPNTLGVTCRQFTVPALTGAPAAVIAFMTSVEYDCWRQAVRDQPLPTCFR